MSIKLYSSHRCLMENLQTFHKMETAYQEIRDYVKEVLQELARYLNSQQSLPKFDEKTIAKGYLEASDILAWKGTEDALVTIGLEGLNRTPDAIVGPSLADPCRAFVYSRYYYSINEDIGIQDLCRKLQSPQGFVAARERGYLFTKDLDALHVEVFCNRQALTKYFSEPLNVLLNWLIKNKELIRRTAELTRK